VSRRYDRESVEFARVLTFNDGLYAIAMTLLIVSIAVPTISDTQSVSDLADVGPTNC
jgi:TMEM175 potassium channel family protein